MRRKERARIRQNRYGRAEEARRRFPHGDGKRIDAVNWRQREGAAKHKQAWSQMTVVRASLLRMRRCRRRMRGGGLPEGSKREHDDSWSLQHSREMARNEGHAPRPCADMSKLAMAKDLPHALRTYPAPSRSGPRRPRSPFASWRNELEGQIRREAQSIRSHGAASLREQSKRWSTGQRASSTSEQVGPSELQNEQRFRASSRSECISSVRDLESRKQRRSS